MEGAMKIAATATKTIIAIPHRTHLAVDNSRLNEMKSVCGLAAVDFFAFASDMCQVVI
jgi:hypothetical protein